MAMAASSRLLWASRAAAYLRVSTFLRAYTVLKDRKYTETHEWVKVEGDSATVGITDYIEHHLGDIILVNLPEAGMLVSKGKYFGAIESVKTASDLNSPVSGEIVGVNVELGDNPGLVNGSPYEEGWMVKVKLSDSGKLNSLMDDVKYSEFCIEQDKK